MISYPQTTRWPVKKKYEGTDKSDKLEKREKKVIIKASGGFRPDPMHATGNPTDRESFSRKKKRSSDDTRPHSFPTRWEIREGETNSRQISNMNDEALHSFLTIITTLTCLQISNQRETNTEKVRGSTIPTGRWKIGSKNNRLRIVNKPVSRKTKKKKKTDDISSACVWGVQGNDATTSQSRRKKKKRRNNALRRTAPIAFESSEPKSDATTRNGRRRRRRHRRSRRLGRTWRHSLPPTVTHSVYRPQYEMAHTHHPTLVHRVGPLTYLYRERNSTTLLGCFYLTFLGGLKHIF